MAKRNKKKRRRFFFLSALKEETRHWIGSVIAFVFAIFFLLAYFNKAGLVGNSAKELFTYLFGVGYFLFPVFLIGLGVTLLSAARPRPLMSTILGGILFFISGLALLSISNGASGGIVGVAISAPFVLLFDTLVARILLLAILFVSLLVFFDATPSRIFSFFSDLVERIKNRPEKGGDAVLDDTEVHDEDGEEEDVEEEEEKYDEDDADASSRKTGGIVGRVSKGVADAKKGLASFTGYRPFKSETYTPPPLSLLETDKGKPGVGDIKANVNIIKRMLQNFGISVEMDEVSIGPSFTRYALKPAQGIKLSRIIGLQNDLSLALAAHPIRIEAPIPGKSLVGIEIPNSKKTTVGLGSLLQSKEIKSATAPLVFPIGRSIAGNPLVGNLNKMPHLLLAGATGSGKSVTIHTIITSLLYRNSPTHLRFIMIDPKRVELTLYNNIPHLLTPVITDPKKAILALKWAAKEMDRRYDILEAESVRDIVSYNKNIIEPSYAKASEEKPESGTNLELPEMMPYIVIVIDELADIMSIYPRELESAIVRIAQMSRAVGIHLILSTQRPQVNIITGLIKANIPARIALQVASQTDSRTILDMGGAEKLLGSGDMLYISGEMSKPIRLQSAYIGEPEIKKVVKFLSTKNKSDAFTVDFQVTAPPKDALFEATLEENLEGDFDKSGDDELYEEAREIIIQSKRASTTYLQRKLKIGYARAARIMDMLEERDVIGPADGAKPREVLITEGTAAYEEKDRDTEE